MAGKFREAKPLEVSVRGGASSGAKPLKERPMGQVREVSIVDNSSKGDKLKGAKAWREQAPGIASPLEEALGVS